MKSWLNARRKAIIAAAIPLVAAILLALLTGEVDDAEISAGVIALISAIAVERTANRQNPQEPPSPRV